MECARTRSATSNEHELPLLNTCAHRNFTNSNSIGDERRQDRKFRLKFTFFVVPYLPSIANDHVN